MSTTRRAFLRQTVAATGGTVALAGCSGLSGERSEANETTDSGVATTVRTTDEPIRELSLENELRNDLGVDAAEFVERTALVADGVLLVRATVAVVDAEKLSGPLLVRATLFHRHDVRGGSDIDLLREYETGGTYDLEARFPDADPERIHRYELALEPSPGTPSN
ncbi:hypothetical protein [Halegenticoccus soli]|uniref:hypothetical protein n=1 Tax=Halegenticoccus soli TaxID=1985678 RepID=UPI000C6C9313|nr:hypothetical protein [Halegenticoccus soli]